MKRFLFLALITLAGGSLYSQQSGKGVDLGVIAQTAYYLGDVNHRSHFYNMRPATGFMVKENLNLRSAVKFTFTHAGLQGTDADFDNGYQQTRQATFTTTVNEVALTYEFNFFEFSPRKKDFRYITPYLTGGLGLGIISTEGGVAPYTINRTGQANLVLPIGAGFRFRISDRVGAGGEWVFRKTFTDEIDGIRSQYYPEGAFSGRQLGYINSKDWYSFAGLYLTYTFYGRRHQCSAYQGTIRINK